MPEEVGPAVARERLRVRLRQLREERDLNTDVVARDMFWSLSKLNRIETGAVTIQPVEVRALLGYYGVQDEKEVSRLMKLAATSRSRQQWWSHHKLSKEYQQFVAYESEASRISDYQTLYVPGLLQTPEYARAITAAIRGQDLDHDDVTARVEVRLNRQRELFERMNGSKPPSLLGVIDESVLLRPVGGADVLRGQLDRLLEVAVHPHVEIVIVPFDAGDHRGLGGNFELLEFEGSRDPDVLFVESVADDFVVKVPPETTTYRETLESVKKAGYTGDAAIAAVRAALKRK